MYIPDSNVESGFLFLREALIQLFRVYIVTVKYSV